VLKGDVSDPDLPPRSVDVVLARHILWTLPDPHASLARWVRLVRPGGRMVLVEGLWCGPDDGGGTSHDEDVRMPWARGVPSAELRAALRDLVASTHVVPLWDPVLWGKDLVHERYLVVAEVGDHVPTWRTERWDPAGSRLLG
jgi:SAM-dependent methyltransferase